MLDYPHTVNLLRLTTTRNGVRALPGLLLFCLIILHSAFCLTAPAQNYTNRWSKVGGGGGVSTGGVFTATGTAGQPDAGNMSGGNYTVNSGFWGLIAVVQTAGAPPLVLRRGGGSNVLVCWPYPSTDFGLQQCTNLNAPNWLAVTNEKAHVGNEWQVTVTPLTGQRHYRYYRLQKP